MPERHTGPDLADHTEPSAFFDGDPFLVQPPRRVWPRVLVSAVAGTAIGIALGFVLAQTPTAVQVVVTFAVVVAVSVTGVAWANTDE